jgi:hypothetical protein
MSFLTISRGMVLSLNFYHSKSGQRAVVLYFFHFGQFFPISKVSAPTKIIKATVHGARTAAAKLEIMDSLAFNNVSTFLASDRVPDNFRHDHSPFSASDFLHWRLYGNAAVGQRASPE